MAATPTTAAKLRTHIGGKLRLEPTGLLPVDPETGIHFSGFTDNWSIGLAMLHTLFTLEHNHVCDLLADQHPRLGRRTAVHEGEADHLRADGEDPHARMDDGHRAAPGRQDGDERELVRARGRGSTGRLEFLDDNELLGGILGSKADHHAAPYSLTEEFVAVYRMHPLMPDDFAFHSARDRRAAREAHAARDCRPPHAARLPSG